MDWGQVKALVAGADFLNSILLSSRVLSCVLRARNSSRTLDFFATFGYMTLVAFDSPALTSTTSAESSAGSICWVSLAFFRASSKRSLSM